MPILVASSGSCGIVMYAGGLRPRSVWPASQKKFAQIGFHERLRSSSVSGSGLQWLAGPMSMAVRSRCRDHRMSALRRQKNRIPAVAITAGMRLLCAIRDSNPEPAASGSGSGGHSQPITGDRNCPSTWRDAETRYMVAHGRSRAITPNSWCNFGAGRIRFRRRGHTSRLSGTVGRRVPKTGRAGGTWRISHCSRRPAGTAVEVAGPAEHWQPKTPGHRERSI
ncbi:hypothetical protein DFR69_10840 [Nocardia neocaledoniensis]|uniref:Uncharacterized protein n=1 Tax=Nocardia neocaledoniensis TaxID=236511 RepID=A0A317NBW3_9NOCA|nr:hypothetical protein DFR69_10840 [Nocardia neocaledoniensis]